MTTPSTKTTDTNTVVNSMAKNIYNMTEEQLADVEAFLNMPIGYDESDSEYDEYLDEEDGWERDDDIDDMGHPSIQPSSSESSITEEQSNGGGDNYQDSMIRIQIDEDNKSSPTHVEEKTEADENIELEEEDIRKLEILLNVVKSNKQECFDEEDEKQIVMRIDACKQNIADIINKKDIYKKIEVLEKKLSMRDLIISRVSQIIDLDGKHSEFKEYLNKKNESMKEILTELRTFVETK